MFHLECLQIDGITTSVSRLLLMGSFQKECSNSYDSEPIGGAIYEDVDGGYVGVWPSFAPFIIQRKSACICLENLKSNHSRLLLVNFQHCERAVCMQISECGVVCIKNQMAFFRYLKNRQRLLLSRLQTV